MTSEQFEREKNYRVALAIAKMMLSKTIIDRNDFKKINTMLIKKYNPLLGNL